jgi:hypothetical protein
VLGEESGLGAEPGLDELWLRDAPPFGQGAGAALPSGDWTSGLASSAVATDSAVKTGAL